MIRNWLIKKLVYNKGVLGWPKNKETLVICSRKIKKLSNINLSKAEYIDLLPIAKLQDFCVENIILAWKTCDFDLLGHFA